MVQSLSFIAVNLRSSYLTFPSLGSLSINRDNSITLKDKFFFI